MNKSEDNPDDGHVVGRPDGAVRDAIEDFYRAAYPRLVASLILVTSNRAAAEDAAQEAFARLLPRWEKVSHYDDPYAWIRRVALQRVANVRRSQRRQQRALARLSAERCSRDAETESVLTALATLPIEQRKILVLSYVYELPLTQIAAELSISPSAAKSRLHRARLAIRSQGLLLGEPEMQGGAS